MTNSPQVSIVMNSVNSSSFLYEALCSVRDQTFKDYELVFVENSTGDETRQLLEKFPELDVNFISLKPRMSLYEARVVGIRASRGQFIAFLDCDDLWMPTKLEKQVHAFHDQNVVVCVTDAAVLKKTRTKWTQSKQIRSYRNKIYDPIELMHNYYVTWSSAVFKADLLKSALREITPKFYILEDFDLMYRSIKHGTLFPIPEILCLWRLHEQNKSKDLEQFIREWQLWETLIRQEKLPDYEKDLLTQLALNKSLPLEVQHTYRVLKDRRKAQELLLKLPCGQLKLKVWIFARIPPKVFLVLERFRNFAGTSPWWN